jgi:5-(carboxyamino)imidazole ribonucleotide synthase
MVNLLGEPVNKGKVVIKGLEEAMKVPGVSIHLYGKIETRPFRKMGHFTVTSDNLNDAIQKAEYIRGLLKITGKDKIDK